MKIDTPEGALTIDDDRLVFEPADDGPTLAVTLDPMPEFSYQRGIYGVGGLSVGDVYVVLRNEQAEAVVTELKRERTSKTSKTAAKRDSDTATAA
jgi:hypothetical protein